jgi:hypothetical protein
MAVEFAPAYERVRLSPISWAAVFASLAVGISVMLLLTLVGLAVGITVVDPAADSPRAITVGAAIWQTASMLIAALVGGYVAARLSGLRRTADGVLHGAVSWGATTLLYAVLALSALGVLTAGAFRMFTPLVERMASAPGPDLTDRAQAQRTLESIGLTRAQARMVVDQLSGGAPAIGATGAAPGETNAQPGTAPAFEQPAPPQPGFAVPPGEPQPQPGQQPFAAQPPIVQERPVPQPPAAAEQPPLTARAAALDMEALGAATAWLAGAVLLSLIFSIGGGAVGVRGVRRTNRRLEQRPVTAAAAEPPPRIVSRPAAGAV